MSSLLVFKADSHPPKKLLLFASMMKNVYFMLKGFSVFKIFKFLFCFFFDHVGKRLDKNVKVKFKFYGGTDWTINNYNTHIVQCLTK